MFLLNKLEKGLLAPGLSQILKAMQVRTSDSCHWAGERRFWGVCRWALPANTTPNPDKVPYNYTDGNQFITSTSRVRNRKTQQRRLAAGNTGRAAA
jgi:hypothetical protein